jgi:hypothetical protein
VTESPAPQYAIISVDDHLVEPGDMLFGHPLPV